MKSIKFIFLLFLIFDLFACSKVEKQTDGWDQVEKILSNITQPTFPDYTLNIIDLGAKIGSENDCLPYIKIAIDSLSPMLLW